LRVTEARCIDFFAGVWCNNLNGIKYDVLQIQSYCLPVTGTYVAEYSGRMVLEQIYEHSCGYSPLYVTA